MHEELYTQLQRLIETGQVISNGERGRMHEFYVVPEAIHLLQETALHVLPFRGASRMATLVTQDLINLFGTERTHQLRELALQLPAANDNQRQR